MANVGGLEQKMAALAGGAQQPNAGGVASVAPLDDYILLAKSSALNATAGSDVSYILKQGQSELMMISDSDEQLLIYIAFKQLVNIKTFTIRGANGPAGNDDISAPKTVKLWVNKPNIDFSDAEDISPTQEFELTSKHLDGDVHLNLDFLKFKSVDNLTVFIQDNQDDTEQTFLNNLQFHGHAIDDFNMNNLKKSG